MLNNAMQLKGLHLILTSMQLDGADFVDLGSGISGMGMPCFAAKLVFNARSSTGLEQLITNVDWCNTCAQKLPPSFRPVFVSGDILNVEHLNCATRIYAFDAVYLPLVQQKIVALVEASTEWEYFATCQPNLEQRLGARVILKKGFQLAGNSGSSRTMVVYRKNT